MMLKGRGLAIETEENSVRGTGRLLSNGDSEAVF